VVDPGPLTTVQDVGRPGLAHLGVPRSGALDGPAAQLANRLVGNGSSSAGLETTVGGVVVRTSAAMTVAVTGARAAVRVDGRSVAFAEAVAVGPGATISVGTARVGVRTYLAVSGGLEVDPVLGSRATDLLSGLGPAPLKAGDWLPVGHPLQPPSGAESVPLDPVADPITLTLSPGPRWDWFDAHAHRSLFAETYLVGSGSNRVALRLEGAPLARTITTELPSEGIVLGAVQVPAGAQPLVFLADHPTTGGYPVIGVVDAAGIAACAQARPGDRVRFRRRAGHRGVSSSRVSGRW
jgi:biotin-dependent carboxylase-like uncharacterized protein